MSTYLITLDDHGIFVVEKSCFLLLINGTEILLDVPTDDHDLPLATVLGDATEP